MNRENQKAANILPLLSPTNPTYRNLNIEADKISDNDFPDSVKVSLHAINSKKNYNFQADKGQQQHYRMNGIHQNAKQ
jgi:hypothetical protein